MTRKLLIKLADCAGLRHRAAWGLALLAVAGCDRSVNAGARSSAARGAVAAAPTAADSVARHTADSSAAMAAAHSTTTRRLSPAADSIAPYLVFAPAEERAFVAAVRNKEWLLDVGRMDLDVRKDSAKARLFHDAAVALSPVAPRSVFRLAWARGAEDIVVDSFAVYNGRIVMRVLGSAALDSAARRGTQSVAYAVRADSAAPPTATTCDLRAAPDSAARAASAALTPVERRAQAAVRKTADSAYEARVAAIRDSLEGVLRAEHPPYERLQRRLKSSSSQVRGCFGAARRALIVSLRAGDAEWVRERLVLVAPAGDVTALRVEDLRFRAHDALTAFDADADGVDDLAVKGVTQRAGGTAVLRVDLAKKRAERLAAGFAWELF